MQQQHCHAVALSAVVCCPRQRPALRAAVQRQRQRQITLASAASDAASPELPEQPVQPMVQQQRRQQRELSLVQRWRQLVVTLRAKRAEAAAAAAALPPVAALLSAWAALQRALEPVYDALEELRKRREALHEDYNQFLAGEAGLSGQGRGKGGQGGGIRVAAG